MTADRRLRPAASSVSVLFPAYDEEATIAGVLDEAHALLSASSLDWEIVVCDDGSKDGTGAIVRAAAARLPGLRAIGHAQNQGIRRTFEDLYAAATKEFVFLNSTDRQWDTAILFEMLPMTSEFDVVIASRRRKHYTPWRRLVSFGFNLVPRALFGVRTFDAGAVKLMRREIIQRFALVSRSPFTEAERLIRAARAGYRIAEHPVATAARGKGSARGARMSLVLQALADVPRVWWDLRRG